MKEKILKKNQIIIIIMPSVSFKERSTDDEYPGDTFYVCCTELSPQFEHFFVAVTKKIFNEFEETLRCKLYSSDNEVKTKAIIETLCVLKGTEKNFDRYKRNVEELKRHARNGDEEYKTFCNDVIIHYAHMRVLFYKPLPLIEHSQMMKIRNIISYER